MDASRWKDSDALPRHAGACQDLVMRLVAWNCCEGFAGKHAALAALDDDVAVVTEGGPFEPGLVGEREVTAYIRRPVNAPGHHRHVMVLARSPWRVTALAPIEDQPWVMAVKASGPHEFTVLPSGRWAANGRGNDFRMPHKPLVPSGTRCRGTGRRCSRRRLQRPTPRQRRGEQTTCGERGRSRRVGPRQRLHSCTGRSRPLSEPTLHFQRRASKPFHIDHVFIPRAWTNDLQVAIGGFADRVATGRSDHVPVVVDLPAVPPRRSC